jgi:hypothetical protein
VGVAENGNRWLYTQITGLITIKEPVLLERTAQHWLNPSLFWKRGPKIISSGAQYVTM